MIRKLRLKFVLICMSLVTAILAVVFSSVFFAIRQNVRDLSRQLLYQVAQNESSLGTGGLPSAQITIGDHHVVLLPILPSMSIPTPAAIWRTSPVEPMPTWTTAKL